MHGLAEYDTGGLALERHTDFLPRHGAEAVKRRADRVYHPAHEALAHFYAGDTAQPAHAHILLYEVCLAQQDRAHVVFFQVHDHGFDSAVEFQQFSGLGAVEPVYAGYTVAHREHTSDLFVLEGSIHSLELLEKDVRNLAGFYVALCHTILLFLTTNSLRSICSWRRTEASSILPSTSTR